MAASNDSIRNVAGPWAPLDTSPSVAETRLQLFALACNLGHFLRQLALPGSVKLWLLTTLREKLIKIGAKVVRHAEYLTLQMAEVAVPRELLAAILERIRRFGVLPPLMPRE